MKNLNQIRAKAALEPARTLKRSAFAKLPSLILSNGLLSAAAYCNAEGGGKNKNDLVAAMKATVRHLNTMEILSTSDDIPDFIYTLSNQTALTLQYATTEALAYLSYLKRFATND